HVVEAAAPTCTDSVETGDESDVDCGGPVCAACATGAHCVADSDCEKKLCWSKVCIEPTCTDNVRTGAETDIDCGGPDCAGCTVGRACKGSSDCTSGVCSASACQAASCTD